MADRLRDQLPARLALLIRLLFAAVGVASLVLGYVGLRAYFLAHPAPNVSHAPGDVFYDDIELFFLQPPQLADGGPYPWPLMVARFSAPSVAAYGVAEIVATLSARRLHRARVHRYRGHVIVYGSTRMADVLALRLRQEQRPVVTVGTPDADGPASDGGTALASLRAAGVAHATALYSCLPDSHRNVQVASDVERLLDGRRSPVRVHAMITDLDLCLALKARRWTATGADGLRVDFFNADELAAQQVVRSDEGAFGGGAAPRVAVVGTGAFGQALVVELARQWLARRDQSADSAHAVLVGADSDRTAASITARYPFLAEACELETYAGTVEDLLTERSGTGLPPLHRLYLCQQDEGEALQTALCSVAHLATAVEAIVVRLDRLSGMAQTFDSGSGGSGLLDALGGRLRVVDVVEAACDPAMIGFDLAEALARTGHQRYLRARLADGVAMGGTAAMTGWDHLPEEFRTASRAQAVDIGRKVAALGALLVPRRARGQEEFRFKPWEVDYLARQEHHRWWAERADHGWRYGRNRDEADRRHPAMVPWSALEEDGRKQDVAAVRAIPGQLAEVGLAIVRVGPPAVHGEIPADGTEPIWRISPQDERDTRPPAR
ncbi:MAG: hypothetical protein HOV83_04145 [Catenulispora sp.]|nr:hypothetical protein [Catenulispora sp.]